MKAGMIETGWNSYGVLCNCCCAKCGIWCGVDTGDDGKKKPKLVTFEGMPHSCKPEVALKPKDRMRKAMAPLDIDRHVRSMVSRNTQGSLL